MLRPIERSHRNTRRNPRLVVNLTAERREGGKAVVDRVLNVSVSGLMLLTQAPIEAGGATPLRLGDEEPKLGLSAAVRWARPSPRWPGTEAGLEFTGVDASTATELELLMTRLLASKQGRRSGVRFAVSVAAHWRGAGAAEMLAVELIDLSLGGAMITGAKVPDYGDRGLLSLDLGEGVIATAASIVWRDVHRVPAASGLSFDPGSEVSEFVAKVMRSTLLQRGDDDAQREVLERLFEGVDPEETDRVLGPGWRK